MRPSTSEGIERRTAFRADRLAAALGVCAAALVAAGCGRDRPEASPPRTPREVAIPAYLRDTVGEIARFAGREPLYVQGIGFVTGLDGTGTRAMPPGVRRQVLELMHRHKVAEPEALLTSPDTAVVTVFGRIPPGARRDERFDLAVRAVPGTDTTSLEGGYVLECDLYRVHTARGVQARGEPLAVGEGSIFVSPFGEEGGPVGSARQGRILGGGRVLKDRRFSLVLLVPSVRTAEQVVRLVNTRFPGAAKGTTDPARVDLRVPARFQDDKAHFLDLVGALYMRETPAARAQRVRLLLETLQRHEDMDRVALCLEAFGPSVAPHLYPLADSADPALRFYAGRTLAHLQDARAVHALEPIVTDEGSPFQEEAVRALGRLESGLGLGLLARALSARSARVRVAAWEASTRLAERTFLVRSFEGGFDLHVVRPGPSRSFTWPARGSRGSSCSARWRSARPCWPRPAGSWRRCGRGSGASASWPAAAAVTSMWRPT